MRGQACGVSKELGSGKIWRRCDNPDNEHSLMIRACSLVLTVAVLLVVFIWFIAQCIFSQLFLTCAAGRIIRAQAKFFRQSHNNFKVAPPNSLRGVSARIHRDTTPPSSFAASRANNPASNTGYPLPSPKHIGTGFSFSYPSLLRGAQRIHESLSLINFSKAQGLEAWPSNANFYAYIYLYPGDCLISYAA